MKNQKNWHLVYTYPNGEKKAYNELVKRKITAFLPTRKEIRSWSDRNKKLEVPLFPNYVFVQVPPTEMWTVLMVNGVVRFVTFDGVPAVVKESEINFVKKILSGHNVVSNAVSNESFSRKGEEVVVKQGPLQGLVGRVMSTKGITKLYVELETIYQTVTIEIDAAILGKVHEVCHP